MEETEIRRAIWKLPSLSIRQILVSLSVTIQEDRSLKLMLLMTILFLVLSEHHLCWDFKPKMEKWELLNSVPDFKQT
jgi:hypothetical protein